MMDHGLKLLEPGSPAKPGLATLHPNGPDGPNENWKAKKRSRFTTGDTGLRRERIPASSFLAQDTSQNRRTTKITKFTKALKVEAVKNQRLFLVTFVNLVVKFFVSPGFKSS
jgi:hypothetical protein